jgi:zinc transport system substrate-binding protein
VAGADLVVYTGFEVMAARLVEAAGSAKVRLLKVGADYSLPTMRATLTAIGDALGTAASARAGIAALEAFLADWRAELAAAGLDGAPVVVHAFQQPLAAELGFTAKGVFGPAPLEAAQIAKLSATGARLVIDNWHNETAGPLKETMKAARFASLLNFPGPSGTVSLLGVLAENRARLKAAAGY